MQSCMYEYREFTPRNPDTIQVLRYLASNERMTHGDSAAVTTSGAAGVCTEAIITWITRISLSLLPASPVQVTSRVPHHFVITPLLAELWTTCMLNHGQRYNGHQILHPLAFRLHPLTITMVTHIIICITNVSRSPACIRFSFVCQRRMVDLIHVARL
jgi:hypothetical protein